MLSSNTMNTLIHEAKTRIKCKWKYFISLLHNNKLEKKREMGPNATKHHIIQTIHKCGNGTLTAFNCLLYLRYHHHCDCGNQLKCLDIKHSHASNSNILQTYVAMMQSGGQRSLRGPCQVDGEDKVGLFGMVQVCFWYKEGLRGRRGSESICKNTVNAGRARDFSWLGFTKWSTQ